MSLRMKLAIVLVVLWPLVLTGIAWLLLADLDPFAGDERRGRKQLVAVLMAGAVPFTFGVRDWWKLVLPEFEPDRPERFIGRTNVLYGVVLAAVAAAYAFVWTLGFRDFRLFPSMVAVIGFTSSRMLLQIEREASPTPPDVTHSPETRIPSSLKRAGWRREDEA